MRRKGNERQNVNERWRQDGEKEREKGGKKEGSLKIAARRERRTGEKVAVV